MVRADADRAFRSAPGGGGYLRLRAVLPTTCAATTGADDVGLERQRVGPILARCCEPDDARRSRPPTLRAVSIGVHSLEAPNLLHLAVFTSRAVRALVPRESEGTSQETTRATSPTCGGPIRVREWLAGRFTDSLHGHVRPREPRGAAGASPPDGGAGGRAVHP